jgi:hypothetical protein
MPFVVFFVTCVASMGATVAFQRELIQKGHAEGSAWDRRFWPYLRRYEDKSLEWKRLAALAANALCIATLVSVATIWNYGR